MLNQMDRLKSLSYSRSLESEADADGLQLLTTRQIDGAGFIRLFELLQNIPGAHQPEWTSSHPNLERRIRNIRQNKILHQQQPHTDTTLQQLFLKVKKVD
jgi:predicted Zn-dependent protease